jgi:hypothetical protein
MIFMSPKPEFIVNQTTGNLKFVTCRYLFEQINRQAI